MIVSIAANNPELTFLVRLFPKSFSSVLICLPFINRQYVIYGNGVYPCPLQVQVDLTENGGGGFFDKKSMKEVKNRWLESTVVLNSIAAVVINLQQLQKGSWSMFHS